MGGPTLICRRPQCTTPAPPTFRISSKIAKTRLPQHHAQPSDLVERFVKRRIVRSGAYLVLDWELRSVANGLASASICEKCGAAAFLSAQIPPLGNTVGKHVFYCRLCDHYTWVDWAGSLSDWAGSLTRRKTTANTVQQQQQQPQPKRSPRG